MGCVVVDSVKESFLLGVVGVFFLKRGLSWIVSEG